MDFARADAFNSALRALAIRHRARAQELLAPLGLHPGQEFLLMKLAADGPQIQSRLAAALSCEPPSITLMAGKLEAAGHVHRFPSPTDRRATVVDLTDAGRQLTARIRAVWIQLAEDTLADTHAIPVEDVAAIFAAMAATLTTRDADRPSAAG
jgi:DNA-binding MarR family transcriptional regulator